MKSMDSPSETLVRIVYAGIIIIGVILLINMLMALLSNTYQRLQVREWSIRDIEISGGWKRSTKHAEESCWFELSCNSIHVVRIPRTDKFNFKKAENRYSPCDVIKQLLKKVLCQRGIEYSWKEVRTNAYNLQSVCEKESLNSGLG